MGGYVLSAVIRLLASAVRPRLALFILACALVTAVPNGAAHAALGQRKSISELTPMELASLRRGVQQMMAWNTEPHGSDNYRRSWVYWANMHLHFGADCAGPVMGPGMAGVVAIAATTPDEAAAWCRCQHQTYSFLTWHRMYLYYFEQVLQAAAKDPTLRLPYWDYGHETFLPKAFRDLQYIDAGVTKDNPLYTAQRRTVLNDGTKGLDPAVVSTTAAFAQSDYWGNSAGFNPLLEQSPHGNVHCAIGVSGCNTGLMGAVPSAALDPIFYLHHANIDRLYDCWLRVDPGKRLPSDPDALALTFSFPDGTGKLVTRRESDMLESAKLGYSYSKPAACPPSTKTGGTGFLSVSTNAAYVLSGPAAIGAGPTSIPLTVPPEARSAIKKSPFLSGTPLHQVVAIDGVAFDQPPASLYKVYLATNAKRSLLGTLNFFSAGQTHQQMAMPGMGPVPFDVIFPATDALHELGLDGGSTANAHIEFVPATGIAGDTPENAAQENSPANNLRYNALRLIAETKN